MWRLNKTKEVCGTEMMKPCGVEAVQMEELMKRPCPRMFYSSMIHRMFTKSDTPQLISQSEHRLQPQFYQTHLTQRNMR